MLSIKISKSWIFKVCLVAALVLSAQFCFAVDPIPLPIPKDGTPKDPPTQTNGMTQEPSVSATISDTELDVYFEYGVGNASITVYDAYNNVVDEEEVDTDSSSAVSIGVSNRATGDYMITVTYGTTTQRGYFSIE